MAKKGKVILVDGNSLLYRAFFAMPHFSTVENQPTNAVYGFTMMLLRLIEEEKPEILLMAFDAPVKTFRHEEYKEYKAHRKRTPDELVAQAPLAREMVDAFNIPRLEIEGFEADDVVGTLARIAEAEDYEVVIVTGDLDALQLVDDKVRVMTNVKGVTETVIYDEAAVERRYGLRPDQLPDFKALKGDPSDNIPGVPGIGDKTAAKLVSEYGSLENILAHVEEIRPDKLRNTLSESVDIALLSKRLATIIVDMPIEIDLDDCRYRKPNYKHLREIFKRLEFRTLLKKLPEDTPQQDLFSQFDMTPPKPKASPAARVTVIRNSQEVDKLVADIVSAGHVAIRVNPGGTRGIDANVIGIALAYDSSAFYFPFDEDTDANFNTLRPIWESEVIAKYGHNLKYELEIAEKNAVVFNGPIFDILLASYLLNPTRGTHDLEAIASDYAGIDLPVLSGKTGKACAGDAEICMEEYFGNQADAIARLAPILEKKLVGDCLDSLMSEVEMPLEPILARMEMAGILIDTEWLNNLSIDLGQRIESLEKSICGLAGTEFNIGSPKQLQMILFEKLGLTATKKTKTGYSTDADTLAALAPAHEIVAKILEYRELTKLKSTYADSLPRLINAGTGRVHTSLNQAVTSTGRLSSSEPNLQNIPIRTEVGRMIRRAFVASPGCALVSADYSQIDLRILAHVSRDPELLEAFREDADVHTRTAVSIFDVSPEEVTPEMRRQAKTVNFAVIYGMSDYGLSRELNIPIGIAKRYIESYFQRYPGVKTYAAETLEKARERGFVETLLKRRRYIPELKSSNRVYREFAERAAVNMPIQGTAADIVKIAMIHVDRELKKSGSLARMILQVHDELVFEVPEGDVESILPVIRECMEDAYQLDVPLKVDVKVGRDWCTALPISVVDDAEVIEAPQQ